MAAYFFVYRYEKYKWRFLQKYRAFHSWMKKMPFKKTLKSHFVKDANLFCRKHQLRLTLKAFTFAISMNKNRNYKNKEFIN